MTAFLARDPIEPAVVDTLCRTHGLTHVRNEPWTNGIVYTQWSDGDATVTLACDGRSEAQVLRLDGAPAALGDAIARDFELEALDDTLELARNASAPLDKIRRLYRAHAFRLVGGEPDRRVVALQCEHLLDEHAWVRWAAARLLAHRATTEVLAAFEEAQSRHGDLERTLERVRAQCAAASDGTLFDEPTDAWDELIRRAREGLEDGKPQRAAKAMDTLLRDSSDHIEGLLLRARAHGAEGDRLVALALLGAAEATAKVEREVRDGKGLAEIERLLKEIVAARDELEDGSGDEATLVAWLTRWAEDGRDTAACGAALAVIDDVPALAGVLSYIAGRYRHDRRRLELARQRAPRSPWCLRALANVQKTDRPAEAVALYEEALTCLNVTDKKREEALIDRLGTALLSSQLAGAPSLEALLLEDLAGLHYDERNWDEAMRHADRLVVTNPKCLTAWQWRANARTFARQHEDAVAAYREAIEVLDEAFDGDGMVVGSDPRPGMHFNLACVLAKLEHHDEALDELRRAVRGDAKWGAEAKSDDYFESLWEDATFARVVSGDPNALVLDEERDPTFIDSLINRATGHCHRGSYSAAIETAERAVRLAKRNEDASLAARGLSVHARALALSGQAELGVAKAVEARALADEGNASARVRSEVAHELGVALHAAGNHDRAADAYQHALELRKEAYGSEHPIVAK